MSGRVTMLGISRWTEEGGSYRTIQRFFKKILPWCAMNWALIKTRLSKCGVILIAGDATTVTKSGKHTFGLGRFFSSIYSRAIPGISFQVLSIIDVNKRNSWPILIEQIEPKKKSKKLGSNIQKAASTKRGRGRPKGAKNKNKAEVKLNEEMKQVKSMLNKVLNLIKETVKPVYFIYDGAFGNNAAVQMTLQAGLHLISKLRYDSKLYFQWSGNYQGKGKPKIYGERINYTNIPNKYLKSKELDGDISTATYQINARHKNFPEPLNVIVISKKNLKTGKQSHVILFSTDLDLGYQEIQEYYCLRFQIEFNFRDAKQHWGLEDFMVTEKVAVLNSANIAFWMVNLSQSLLPVSNAESILDLKSHHHGLRYAKEVFKLLPKNAQPINNEVILEQVSAFSRIHNVKIAA